MKIITLFFAIFLLFACSDQGATIEKNFLDDKSISVSKKIKQITETDYLKQLGCSELEITWIQKYYQSRAFKPLFSNDSTMNERGIKLTEQLEQSLYYGVPQKRILKIKKELHSLEKEVLLSANFAVLLEDLNRGSFSFETKKFKERTPVELSYFKKQVQQLDTISFSKLLLKQGPKDTNYRFLAKHTFDFCQKRTLDTTVFKLKTAKDDSIDVLGRVKEVLVSKHYLTETADSSQIVEQLKVFQLENGLADDGKLGKNTVKALNESNYNKVIRATIAMERLRSKTDSIHRYVRINLPEFKLYFFCDDTLRSEHRIIIGKETNQTPELVSKINRITCFPFWRVPASIASKEILPDLKRNSNYLVSHHYKLYSRDKEVNSTAINWKKYSSFPFTVVQQPGIWNSLGLVKFEFNNSHSVYVHDTPTRGLFRNAFRSYSHGCMRCEHPQELAKVMLKYDSIGRKEAFTSEKFDSLMNLKTNYSIGLKIPIPILIQYQTVVAYRDRMVFYFDLYNREEELVAIFRKD